MAGVEPAAGAAKKSDLKTRTLSALVMLVVAGTALGLGGWWWTAFAALVAIGVLREWEELARKFTATRWGLALWIVAGAAYVGIGLGMLMFLRRLGPVIVLFPLLAVIATDVGAYFAGRRFGGPRIAPRISPSKTWSGLGGGLIGAALVCGLFAAAERGRIGCDPHVWRCTNAGLLLESLIGGALIAIVAQSGDFFESWMKRRASVKDSGYLLPGHGGLFDRVDGLLAVLFVSGVGALLWVMIG